MMRILYIAIVFVFATAGGASAYVGPGAGLSLLGALWGLLLAIGAALAFVIAWPLRRLIKRARAKKNAETGEGETVSDPDRTTGSNP